MGRDASRRRFLKTGVMAAAGASLLGVPAPAFAQLSDTERRALGWQGVSLPPDAIDGPWRTLRAVRDKRVFDVHVHSYETPTQGSTYAETNRLHASDHYVDFTDQLVASMDRHGIAQAALTPAFVTYEQVLNTSFKKYPTRFVLAAGFPPESIKKRRTGLTLTGAEAELTPQEVAAIYRNQIVEDGARLIGETAGNVIMRNLMPRYAVKELKPVVDVILEHDVPLQFHTGWSPTATAMGAVYGTAQAWAQTVGNFLGSYPEVKAILGHTGGQFPQIDGWEAVRLLFSFDNAYADVSKSSPEIVTALVKGIGAERVLFGSDWNRPEPKTYGPFHVRGAYQHWYNLNTIARADITEDERDWVLYRSARKLLKLDS